MTAGAASRKASAGLRPGAREALRAAVNAGQLAPDAATGEGVEMWFCLFEGSSEDTVRTVNERAGIPSDRIAQAVLVTSEDLT